MIVLVFFLVVVCGGLVRVRVSFFLFWSCLLALDPADGLGDSLLPELHLACSSLVSVRGLEHGLVLGVDGVELVKGLPDAHGETGGDGGAQSGGLEHGGAHNVNSKEIGLDLHGNVGVADTAVDAEGLEGLARVLLHGIENGLGLEAHGLETGTADVALLGVLGQTENGTAGVVAPVRGEETREGRDKDDAGIVLDLAGELANLLGRVDELDVVTQPLDGGAGHGNGTFQSVHGRVVAKLEADCGQQAVLGDDGLGAGVVEQEATGAVCVLGLTGREAELADEGSRLVTEAARDGDAGEGTSTDASVDLRGGDNLGEDDLLDAKELDELVVVLEGLDVHQHGSGGIGGIGDVSAAVETTEQVPEEPGVDGAESQVALLVDLSDLLVVVEHPSELDSSKVCGNGQAAEFLDSVGAGLGLELGHGLGGSGVGPDNGVGQRLTSLLVPDTGGFSLVGDTNGLDLLGLDAEALDFLADIVEAFLGRLEQLAGVVLNPAGALVNLSELLLLDGDNLTLGVEEDEAGGGSTLVKSSDVRRHCELDVCGLREEDGWRRRKVYGMEREKKK